MKVALIGIERALTNLGLRYIASSLKAAGHTVCMLFLAREFNDFESPADLDHVLSWLRTESPGLVGISLMSSHLKRAVRITDAIQTHLQLPVIWGGIHPTTDPEGCIIRAPFVCIGEGELAMAELAAKLDAGEDVTAIPGIWAQRDGAVFRNRPAPRIADLDNLPFPDYSMDRHFILHGGRIVPLTEPIMTEYFFLCTGAHYAIATRGCPFNCSYCCNSALRNVATGPYVRRRSVDNIINELKHVKAAFRSVRSFALWDDSFTSGSPAWLEDFCRRYKQDIALPFLCNLQPLHVTEQQVAMLVDAGLIGIHMGFQTGSDEVNRTVFHRSVEAGQFLAATRVLDKYKHVLDRHYHVIVDNPYEPERETLRTAQYVAQFEKPYYLSLCSLMFYPATELYHRALADGLLAAESNPVFEYEYYRHSRAFLNLVMRATPVSPRALIAAFLEQRHNPVARILFYLYYYGYYHGRHRLLDRLLLKFRKRRVDETRDKISDRDYAEVKVFAERRK